VSLPGSDWRTQLNGGPACRSPRRCSRFRRRYLRGRSRFISFIASIGMQRTYPFFPDSPICDETRGGGRAPTSRRKVAEEFRRFHHRPARFLAVAAGRGADAKPTGRGRRRGRGHGETRRGDRMGQRQGRPLHGPGTEAAGPSWARFSNFDQASASEEVEDMFWIWCRSIRRRSGSVVTAGQHGRQAIRRSPARFVLDADTTPPEAG